MIYYILRLWPENVRKWLNIARTVHSVFMVFAAAIASRRHGTPPRLPRPPRHRPASRPARNGPPSERALAYPPPPASARWPWRPQGPPRRTVGHLITAREDVSVGFFHIRLPFIHFLSFVHSFGHLNKQTNERTNEQTDKQTKRLKVFSEVAKRVRKGGMLVPLICWSRARPRGALIRWLRWSAAVKLRRGQCNGATGAAKIRGH